jgi:hypothetical protein
VLLSHWLGAKQETGIKNQLIIQETKQKNALLSITIQQLDDGAEKGIYSSARQQKILTRTLSSSIRGRKKRAPHSIAHVRSLKKGTRVYCVRVVVKENGKRLQDRSSLYVLF